MTCSSHKFRIIHQENSKKTRYLKKKNKVIKCGLKKCNLLFAKLGYDI